MFVYFADFFSTMFVYYIMFVYGHVQNNVPYTLRCLLNKQYLLNAGTLLAGALLTAHFKLDMEKNFHTIDLNFHNIYNQVIRFQSCLVIQLSRTSSLLFRKIVFHYVRLLYLLIPLCSFIIKVGCQHVLLLDAFQHVRLFFYFKIPQCSFIRYFFLCSFIRYLRVDQKLAPKMLRTSGYLTLGNPYMLSSPKKSNTNRQTYTGIY